MIDQALTVNLSPSLRQFIPQVLFRWPSFLERADHLGALIFLDVAGFTRLSEALASMGAEGAERLDATIAQYFDALFEAIQAFDGHPIKVSGDALSILFWEPETSLADLTRRAVACAARLRGAGATAAEVNLPGGDTLTLSHKVGVGIGEIWCTFVGDPAIQRECIFAGEALDRAAQAEHHATTGQVWVCPEVVTLLDTPSLWAPPAPSGCCRLQDVLPESLLESVTSPLSPGFSSVSGSPLDPDSSLALYAALPPDLSWLGSLVPSIMRSSIQDGTLDYLSKHKSLTALFVSFSGLEFRDLDALTRLDQHYRAMQAIVWRHGGFLAEFDAGDKGSKLILFFGAPHTIERPSVQAALCAREMQLRAMEMGIVTSQRIGISTGRLYVGRIGCRNFAKFSALGDRMNLAARLMATAAPWTVLAESLTLDRSQEWVEWGERRQIQVKGKVEPITVAQLELTPQKAPSERRGRTLVGRERELDLAEQALDGLADSTGGLLLIEGQTGIGKTRILDAIATRVQERGQKVCRWSTRVAQPISRPFAAFVPLLRELLQRFLDLSAPFEVWRHQLPPAIRHTAGALAWLLGLPGADTPDGPEQLEGVSPAQRITVLNRSLVDVIVHLTMTESAVLLCDDAQHLDAASLGTLKELAPFLCELHLVIILAGRSAAESPDPWLSQLASVEGVKHRELQPLEADAIEAIALKRLGVSAIDRELRTLLTERSGGNPLRLESWIDVLKGRDQVTRVENTAFLGGLNTLEQLPDTIELLLLTRLERLPADAALTLATATVLEGVFYAADLAAIHPEGVSEAVVIEHLKLCHSTGLIYHRRSGEGGYYFASRELCLALYDSQSFSFRRALHQRRVELLLQRDTALRSDEEVMELASHLVHVDLPERQQPLFRQAALISERCFDHRAAVQWWQRCVEICEKACSLEPLNEAFDHLQQELGLMGEREARRALIDRWVSSHPLNTHSRWHIPALLQQARLEAREGGTEQALEQVVRAISLARASQDTALLAAALCEASTIYGEAGRHHECLTTADEAMALPVKQDGPLWLRMLTQQGFALYACGKPDAALTTYRSAQALLGDSDLGQRAVIQGNIALTLWAVGRVDEAHTLLLESLAVKRRIGDRREEAMSLLNVGYSYYRLGQCEEACRYTEEARSIFVRLRNAQGEQLSTQNLLELYLNAEDFHRAMLNAHRAEALLQKRPNLGQRLELLTLKGELFLIQSEPQRAQQLFEEARRGAVEATLSGPQLCALEGLAATYLALGALETARLHMDEALRLLERAPDDHPFPQRVWLRAARLAQASGNASAATQYHQRARSLLLEQLSRVTSPEARAAMCRAFWWNREILEAETTPATPDFHPSAPSAL